MTLWPHGMTHLRQGVVFGKQGDMERTIAKGAADRRWQPAHVPLDGKAGLVQPISENAAGQRLLVANLGVVVDPVGKFDQGRMCAFGALARNRLGVDFPHLAQVCPR
jgi:hypothetical protein